MLTYSKFVRILNDLNPEIGRFWELISIGPFATNTSKFVEDFTDGEIVSGVVENNTDYIVWYTEMVEPLEFEPSVTVKSSTLGTVLLYKIQ